MKTRTLLVTSLLAAIALLMPGQIERQANAVTDDPELEFVSHIGGTTYAVSVQGQYAYIGEGFSMTILDISNPESPRAVGNTEPWQDWVQDIKVSGSYAYVAVDDSGLRIVDVSDPANPLEVGSYEAWYAYAIDVAGDYAYVAQYGGDLRIIDVSSPKDPVEVGVFDTDWTGCASDVQVLGSHVYLASCDLRIIDISNPADPTEVGLFNPSGLGALGIHVVGNRAYLPDLRGQLLVIDVSDPTNPTEIDFCYTPEHHGTYTLFVEGNHAYVGYYTSDGGGLQVVDLESGATEAGFFESEAWDTPVDVFASGGYAFVATGDTGLQVVNVSNPANPQQAGVYETPQRVKDVHISGSYMYIANEGYIADVGSGLWVVDASDPAHPQIVGYNEMLANAVYVSGNYAYVTSQSYHFYVVDVSDPRHPWEVGSCPILANMDVFVSGSYAYVTAYDGLHIVDISNPANPIEVGFYSMSGYVYGVYVSGDLAYVAAREGGLSVLDISDPQNPTKEGFYDTYALDVHVAGSYAYVAAGDEGLLVLDVSDPANPWQAGHYSTWSAARIHIFGSHAYLGQWIGGLLVLDISTTSPRNVGSYNVPADYGASGVYGVGGYIAVTGTRAGLLLFSFRGGTTYSASGDIHEGGGNPISGVKVSAGPGILAKTDSSGHYTIDGLVNGEYTLVPLKSGWIFMPAAIDISVPSELEDNDFTGVVMPVELIQAVRTLEDSTGVYLDKVLNEANRIAQDGDYFALKVSEDKFNLVATALFDLIGTANDAMDSLGEAEDLLEILLPGVAGRGWGHINGLKKLGEPAKKLFSEALSKPITDTSAKEVAKQLITASRKYYVYDVLQSLGLSETQKGMAKAWTAVLQQPQAFQNLYLAQQEMVTAFKQDVIHTSHQAIVDLPWQELTLEKQELYRDDLSLRRRANIVLFDTFETRALPLHQARVDREADQGSWIDNFLVKYAIKQVAIIALPGVGGLAVEGGYLIANLIRNYGKLEESERMVNLGAEGMNSSLDIATRISLNSAHGMEMIILEIDPQIPRGNYYHVKNWSQGEWCLGIGLSWCEAHAYSEIRINNFSAYTTTFQVFVSYTSGEHDWLVSEEAITISPGSFGDIEVSYKKDDLGYAPAVGSVMGFNMLGTTDTGTYLVEPQDLPPLTWEPGKKNRFGTPLPVSTQAQTDVTTIPYPVRTRMTVQEEELTYTPYVWVDNPFTRTVVITLTQPLPADVEVVDSGGGSTIGSSLRWHQTVEPSATVGITHSVQYLGGAGELVIYPEPLVEMTDLAGTTYLTFTGETEDFTSQPPLAGVGSPPLEIEQGVSVTFPITVTNRAGQEATGTVQVSVVDYIAEVAVYSYSQVVSVPARGSQVVDINLADTIPGGDYLHTAIIESNGAQEEAFTEYLTVTAEKLLYLPLLLKKRVGDSTY